MQQDYVIAIDGDIWNFIHYMSIPMMLIGISLIQFVNEMDRYVLFVITLIFIMTQ